MEETFNNKTILITGGAGFIGSNLAFYFQNNYPSSIIVVFDIFRNGQTFANGNLKSFGHYKNLIGFKGVILCGDITNDEDLKQLDAFKFDYIFHKAAISDTRIYDQEIIFRTNVNSFHKLLKMARLNDAKVVYASSASTYGSSLAPQKIGDDQPESPYGFSKYNMDVIAKNHMKAFPNIHIVGLKYFNVYGPNEFFKNKTASMVMQLGHQILANKNPQLFKGSQNIKRDFVYIKDVIWSNVLAAKTHKSGIFNIGFGDSRSFLDIANILCKELNSNLSIAYFENPYLNYQLHTKADISLSAKHLSYFPKYSLEQGIKDFIPYIEKSFNWNNE